MSVLLFGVRPHIVWSSLRTIIQFSTNKIRKIRQKYFHKIFKHAKRVFFHWQMERDVRYRQYVYPRTMHFDSMTRSACHVQPRSEVIQSGTSIHLIRLRCRVQIRTAGSLGSAEVTPDAALTWWEKRVIGGEKTQEGVRRIAAVTAQWMPLSPKFLFTYRKE